MAVRKSTRRAAPVLASTNYFDRSSRPLQILAFLLPLILAYELSLVVLLRSSDGVITNNAHKALLEFFRAFGVEPLSGFYLGGIMVAVVLLVWHFFNRDPWTIDLKYMGFMAIESLILALPLLVIGQLIHRVISFGSPELMSGAAGLPDSLAARIAISLGAGLYEELMFRMLLIAVIHTLLVDVGKATHSVGAAIAIVVSAAAFTWYHPLGDTTPQSVQRLAFFFIAGLYFGGIYVLRGFGIVVAVHALYDIITFVLQSKDA